MSNPVSTEPKSCPITRDEFRTHAKPLQVQIDGQSMIANVKEFETGSVGWNISSKATISIGGKPCRVQIGCNITVIGSKQLPK